MSKKKFFIFVLFLFLFATPLFAAFKPAGIFDNSSYNRKKEKAALGISFGLTTPMRNSKNDNKKTSLIITGKMDFSTCKYWNILLGFGMLFDDEQDIISLPVEVAFDYKVLDYDISYDVNRAVSPSSSPLSSGFEYNKRRQYLALRTGLGFKYCIPVNSNDFHHYNPCVNFAFDLSPFDVFPFIFEMRFSPGWSWYVKDSGDNKNNFSFCTDVLFMIGVN